MSYDPALDHTLAGRPRASWSAGGHVARAGGAAADRARIARLSRRILDATSRLPADDGDRARRASW